MKYFSLLIALTLSIPLINSCGNACEDVNCVNGDCNEGICDCELGWTGDLCDEEVEPFSINVSMMTIEKFNAMDGSREWDNEDDDSKGDITLRVYDLQNKYFEPTDLNNQLHENADGSKSLEIPCSFKLRDMRSDVTFEVVDYDFDDNFNVVFEFIGSVTSKFKDKYQDFPNQIVLESGTGSTRIVLDVTYSF
ncbi:MAG: hypothetical protein JXQ87_04595 [Bacteroidia bacterium]